MQPTPRGAQESAETEGEPLRIDGIAAQSELDRLAFDLFNFSRSTSAL